MWLILIGGGCGLLLVNVDAITAPSIDANRQAERLRVYAELIPETALTPDSLTPEMVAADRFGTCDTGLVARLSEPGYAGTIEVITHREASALSMRVVRHLETPGIGDFIDGIWMTSRDGLSHNEWQHIDRVSGATVTTAAIQRLAQRAIGDADTYCEEQVP